MFASDYQGGTHVEVLSTQGQNPLGQWKVTGPQKGVQKVYDKALKAYVFASSGGCRLTLPKDERMGLGLVQPFLLVQLEIGVGVPFSLEVGVSDAAATRRRIIFSSSFSDLKCTPLHCQVPFSSLPRECWLNLVLPLADLTTNLFRGAAATGGTGGTTAAAGSTAAGTAGGSSAFRCLDTLQLTGTCRLRRICTLREAPPQAGGGGGGGAAVDDGHDGSASPVSPSPKPLDFPSGTEHQTLLLDPRSLALINHGSAGSMGPSFGLLSSLNGGAAGGGTGGGLGVVGTATGSARRPIAASAASGSGAAGIMSIAAAAGGGGGGGGMPLPSVGSRAGVSVGGVAAGVRRTSGTGVPLTVTATGASGSGAGGCSEEELISPPRDRVILCSGPGMNAGCGSGCDTPGRRGSGSGQSTPTMRGGGGGGGGSTCLPVLMSASSLGPNADLPHSRLGRTPSGGFSPNGSLRAFQPQQLLQQPTQPSAAGGASGPGPSGPPGSGSGPGSLPPLEPSSIGSGLKLPRVVHGNGNGPSAGAAAAAAAAAATTATATATSGTTTNLDDVGRGDGSPFGGRRALSAQTVARHSQTGSGTPPGSAGGGGKVPGSGAAAGFGGGGAVTGAVAGGGGAPSSPPWPRAVMGKRAQSGPARLSSESLSQGLGDTTAPADTPMSPSLAPRQSRRPTTNIPSLIPPTIVENETASVTTSSPSPTAASSPSAAATSAIAAGVVPSCASPSPSIAKSPSRSPSRIRLMAANAIAASATTRMGVGTGNGDAASPALPQLRLGRLEPPRPEPISPVHSSMGAVNNSHSLSEQLSTVLKVRGGVDASMDFASHIDGSPGTSCILSTNHKLTASSIHTHRYGNCGAGMDATMAAATDAARDASSDSDGGGGAAAAAPSTSAPSASSSHMTMASADAMSVKVPRIRTRVLPGGGTAGGGGTGRVSGTAPTNGGPDGSSGPGSGRSASTPTLGPGSPPLPRRGVVGSAGVPDNDGGIPTPTRASRLASQNGRNSPANAHVKVVVGDRGGRSPPVGGGGSGPGASSCGPGPSNLGPATPAGGRVQRRDPDSGSQMATGSMVGTGTGRLNGAAASGSVGAVPSTPLSSATARSSPARQRPTPSGAVAASTTTARTLRAAAVAGEVSTPARERLPPLGGGGAGGGGGGGPAGRSRGGAAGTAAAPGRAGATPSGGQRSVGVGGRGGGTHPHRTPRPTTSVADAVDAVEDSIALDSGMWGGFGVDEDDDLLGSRHFRSGGAAAGGGGGGGTSGSDGDVVVLSGPGPGSRPESPESQTMAGSLTRGGGGGPVGFGRAPPGVGDEMSPPAIRCGHHHVVQEALSPSIRRSRATGTGDGHGPTHEATFSGFMPLGHHHVAYGVEDWGGAGGAASGAYGGGGGGRVGEASLRAFDGLLDEEALLAGQMGHDLAQYDDWARVDQRPTPPELLHAHRAFTPPVVPASKTLGVAIAGRGAGGAHRGASRGGGGGGGGDGMQVLRVGGGGAGGRSDAGVVAPASNEAMLDLMYDPVLNCYYDGATGQYYELRT